MSHLHIAEAQAMAKHWHETGEIEAKVTTLGIPNPELVLGEVIAQDQVHRFRAHAAAPDELLAIVMCMAQANEAALLTGFCRELQAVLAGDR